MQIQFSHHAEVRMRQRGMRNADIAALCLIADIDVPVARDLYAMRLSRQAVTEARAAGVPLRIIERLARAVAVESGDGTLVTCARLHGRAATSYRKRGSRKFWSN
jgi:hypothetical protein